jgi:membrane dipeptidase
VGVLLTFQGSDHFRSPTDVDTFFALGQRVSQLTYNYQNRLGSGFLETKDGGLTVFGADIVKRMNSVGMAVDLSHCGDRTTLDGIAASSRPVIFSHASARALAPDHARCKTDEMIRGMARSGGAMGIPFLRMMIRADEPVTIEHVIDHFDHVARLVGISTLASAATHGRGGNPNPVNGEPMRETPNWDRYRLHKDEKRQWMLTIRGLDHPRRMFDLTEGLIRRGYTDQHIRLILGELARVTGAIQAPPGAFPRLASRPGHLTSGVRTTQRRKMRSESHHCSRFALTDCRFRSLCASTDSGLDATARVHRRARQSWSRTPGTKRMRRAETRTRSCSRSMTRR